MSLISTLTDAIGLTDDVADIDNDMQKVLDAMDSLHPKPIEEITPQEARQQPSPADAVRKVLRKAGESAASQAIGKFSRIDIAGLYGDIPLYVYTPQGSGPFPIILYFHGGGFVIASTEVYDATPRALANGVNAVVVSVDYHLAPEHKYPAAVEDAFVAYQWVLQNHEKLNGIEGKVAVAGESAGANLATVVSMRARDEGLPLPLHQLLVYPVVDNDFTTASYLENEHAKPLNVAMMHWFFKHYGADANSPYALPMKAGSLKGMPPATVITAEIDPLRSEGKAYADRLADDGVDVAYQHYDGVTHEFFGMGAIVEKAQHAMKFATDKLKNAF